MDYDKNDFIVFCSMIEEDSEFQYNETNLTETETGYNYAATFKDQFGYNIPVNLYLNRNQIGWDEPDFYGDEIKETKPFLKETIQQIFVEFENQNPLTRIFSPKY